MCTLAGWRLTLEVQRQHLLQKLRMLLDFFNTLLDICCLSLFLFRCKGAKAALTIDRGAEAPLYAALLPPKSQVTQIQKSR